MDNTPPGSGLPNEPRLTEPLNFSGSPNHQDIANAPARTRAGVGWGSGGGEESDNCPGPEYYEHHHRHHPTTSGLAEYLKLFYRHNWAPRLIQLYGFDLVLQVLDEITETYGVLLDAPTTSYRKPARQPKYFTADEKRPPPEIHSPAGFITFSAKAAYDLAQTSGHPDALPQQTDDLQQWKRRASGGAQ